MYTRRNKWLIIFFASCIAWLCLTGIPQIKKWIAHYRFTIPRAEPALVSTAYLLEQHRWLEFEIPRDTPLAKIVCNPVIWETNTFTVADQFNFAIQYEAIKRNGQSNISGSYHLKASPRGYYDKISQRFIPANYILEPGSIPLGSAGWVINLQSGQFKETSRLRIRLATADHPITMVLVRVYVQKNIPARKAIYIWNRLSDDQKENLARGNVHPFQMLTDWEIASLLRYHWSGVAPKGIPKKDFKPFTFYIRDDVSDLEPIDEWAPAGVPSNSNLLAIIPITNTTSKLILRGIRDSETHLPITNTLTWYPWLKPKPQTNQITWTGTEVHFDVPNQIGLLQIHTTLPVYWQLLELTGNKTNFIFPTTPNVVGLVASSNNPVEFRINHVSDSYTLLRLDVRIAHDNNTPTSLLPPPSLHYQLLDSSRRTVSEGIVEVTNQISMYDRIVRRTVTVGVSDPQSLYFVLTTNIRFLRILADTTNVIVTAYCRPDSLPKKSVFPQDHLPGLLTPEHPTWFTLRPPDYLERRMLGLTCLISIQPRPPQQDPLLLSQLYEWESLTLKESIPGNLVMHPITTITPLRLESLPFLFTPIPVGTNTTIELQSSPLQEMIDPTIVILGSNIVESTLTVSFDNQPVFQGRLPNDIATIRLRRIAPGLHSIKIQCTHPNAQAFINYRMPSNPDLTPTYSIKFCVPIQTNHLKFNYSKTHHSNDLIVIRVYSPLQTTNACLVSIRLRNIRRLTYGPFTQITIPKRETVITRPLPYGTSYVLTKTVVLDEGLPLMFPVGADVPPGDYELEVETVSKETRWISVARITPGQWEKILLNTEPLY